MSVKSKKPLVPRLRFAEFRDVGGWEVKTLDEKIRLEYGGALPELKRNDGNIPVIGSNGIVGYHNQYLVLGPAIVIGRKGSVGQINWIESNCYPIDTTYYVVSIDSNNTLFEFIKLLLQNCGLSNLQDESAVPGLNRKRVYALKAAFPSDIKEQQKIAACLAALDDLISAATGRLDALKRHKQGLMQQLFPAEGETVPRLRFPEFEGAGEWAEYPISDFAKVTTGDKDTQNKVEDGAYPFFVRSQAVERIDSYSYDGEAILTSGDGVGVGKNFHYIDGKFDFHQRVYCIYDFDKTALGRFVFQYFSEYFYKRVMKLSAKNSVDSVRMKMIKEMPLKFPSIEEQQKIAACLTALDDLISAQTQKIAKLKTHKRGLMQQLFPAVDETHR